MIDEMNLGLSGDAARRLDGLRVHDDDGAELLTRQIVGTDKGKRVAIERAKIADVAIQSMRQNRNRFGIDFFCAEQRGQRIEIGIVVREDGVHRQEL